MLTTFRWDIRFLAVASEIIADTCLVGLRNVVSGKGEDGDRILSK